LKFENLSKLTKIWHKMLTKLTCGVFVIVFLSVACDASGSRLRMRMRREGGGWGAPQQQQQPQQSYQPQQQPQQSYQPQQQQQTYQPQPYIPQQQPLTNYNNYNSNQQQGQGAGAEAPTVFPTECAAALLCVNEAKCDSKGVISDRQITEPEKQFRVALSGCTHNETGEIGVCCRDPNYKDPWPDMGGAGQGHEHHHTVKDSSGGFNNGQYKPQYQQPQQQQYQQPQPQPQQQQYQQPQQQQQYQQAQPQPQVQQYQPLAQRVDIPASPTKGGAGYSSSASVQCAPSY
jgi:hypothetical protein